MLETNLNIYVRSILLSVNAFILGQSIFCRLAS